jgi:hypothetical protein
MAGTTRADELEEAAAMYIAYLIEAYGFARDDVTIPDSYRGRELDWFGDLNEILTELEDYRPAEVFRILTDRNPWVRGGGPLLSVLRSGDRRGAMRILRRY